MAVVCWVGMLSFDFCCRGPWGVGVKDCWEGPYDWDLCCKPELERKNVTPAKLEEHLATEKMTPPGQAPRNHALEVLASPDAPVWLQSMQECLSQYDARSSRRWFLAHSGIPAHFVAHVGNPGACVDGGHTFYWGLLVVGINLAGSPAQGEIMSDVALEFSICVPKVCQYAVVDAVLVPFYLGPYLGKPWGPNPEFLYRFKHLGGGLEETVGGTMEALEVSASDWMGEILLKGPTWARDFYAREWPWRRELWEYQTTWRPSPRNAAILAFLAFPPLVAGLCLFCLGFWGLSLPSLAPPASRQEAEGSLTAASESSSQPAAEKDAAPVKDKAASPVPVKSSSRAVAGVEAAVSLAIKGFAPQTYIEELAAPIEKDLVGMHVMRLVLQALVCWQHVILFVEWLGNAGHHGIATFLPLTNDIARMMGRVNSTFACLTVHLSLQSVVRTLQAADRRAAGAHKNGGERTVVSSEQGGAGASASNGRKARRPAETSRPAEVTQQQVPASPSSLAAPSAGRTIGVLWFWTLRRWVRQAAELALWTFYFNEVTQDIPWKPFPDFVQVWYRDRAKSCRRWLAPTQPQLPMWLLSLFFVYEPVNAVLRVHQTPVSLCHNMQVFENLFQLSVCGAFLGAVRHCLGRKALLGFAVLVSALAVRRDPPWPVTSSGGEVNEEAGWDMVIYSTLQMLPAAVCTAILLSEVWPEPAANDKRSSKRHLRAAGAVITLGLVLDLINLGHAGNFAECIPFDTGRKLTALAIRSVQKGLYTLPTGAFFLCEGLHAAGIALLVRSFKPESDKGAFPGWARCISRLSLSVNLTNIFTIHYVRGRMLDHPVEFSHVHGLTYAVFAWGAAVVASLIAHCMVAPYVAAAEAGLSRLSRLVFGRR